MRKWNLFTFWIFVVFGALSVIAAVVGFALLFFAPPVGGIALFFSVILGLMSFSLKRSFDSMTRRDG